MGITKRALAVLTIGVLPLFGSCIFDAEKAVVDDGGGGVEYRPLDKRDNVLHNLELAYNQRNFEEYQKLFDNSGVFLFFFSPTDVSQGFVQNSSWDIGRELEATARLFDRTPSSGDLLASKITLELTYTKDTEGQDNWQPFEPPAYPGETWYQKSVEYRLDVKVDDNTYTQNEAIFAMFTVRQKPGASIWQIVEWKDDI
jgi:hypothetical protein